MLVKQNNIFCTIYLMLVSLWLVKFTSRANPIKLFTAVIYEFL
jgi:hypothetical protein